MNTLQSPAVTGATGFIGQRLIARLCEEGVRPRALVLPGEKTPEAWQGKVDVMFGDVRERASLGALLDGASVVFHLVAKVGDWGREEEFQQVTVEGSRNLLEEAATRHVQTVLASSIVVYGSALATESCDEEIAWGEPAGMYSHAKQAQERLAWELAKSRDLKLTVVRPSNVYGPHSGPWVKMVLEQLQGKMPALIGGGNRNAHLVYVDNVVDVFVRAATTPQAVGRAYNACDGLDVTWKQYFGDLARIAKTHAPRSVPTLLAKGSAYASETLWKALKLSGRPPVTHEALSLVSAEGSIPTRRAERELGFQPKVAYQEALAAIEKSLGE